MSDAISDDIRWAVFNRFSTRSLADDWRVIEVLIYLNFYTYFSMGRVFVELKESLLMLKWGHEVDLNILHLVNLEGGFNDIFDVNIWFGVDIFIYNYFKYFLTCLTTREIFQVLVDDIFWIFDGDGWIKNLYNPEENDMFLCNIYNIFFCDCSKFQCEGCGVAIIDNFDYFCMCDSVMV